MARLSEIRTKSDHTEIVRFQSLLRRASSDELSESETKIINQDQFTKPFTSLQIFLAAKLSNVTQNVSILRHTLDWHRQDTWLELTYGNVGGSHVGKGESAKESMG